MSTPFLPALITKLPGADIPLPGVVSHLAQAGQQQLVFMMFDGDVAVPEHSHEAQWGVVLDGEMELTVEGRVMLLRRGDRYFIPKGARHSARIKRGFKDLTLFDQKDRYAVKGTCRQPA